MQEAITAGTPLLLEDPSNPTGEDNDQGSSGRLARAWSTSIEPELKLALMYLANRGRRADPVALANFAGYGIETAQDAIGALERRNLIKYV